MPLKALSLNQESVVEILDFWDLLTEKYIDKKTAFSFCLMYEDVLQNKKKKKELDWSFEPPGVTRSQEIKVETFGQLEEKDPYSQNYRVNIDPTVKPPDGSVSEKGMKTSFLE